MMTYMLVNGNPLIIAAENNDDGSCGSSPSPHPSPHNDSNFTLIENHNNSTNDNTSSCSDDDAHVAQGIAFFLQNFFILLRLVATHTYNSRSQLKLFPTVLLYLNLEEQKKTQTAFEHEKLHAINRIHTKKRKY